MMICGNCRDEEEISLQVSRPIKLKIWYARLIFQRWPQTILVSWALLLRSIVFGSHFFSLKINLLKYIFGNTFSNLFRKRVFFTVREVCDRGKERVSRKTVNSELICVPTHRTRNCAPLLKAWKSKENVFVFHLVVL